MGDGPRFENVVHHDCIELIGSHSRHIQGVRIRVQVVKNVSVAEAGLEAIHDVPGSLRIDHVLVGDAAPRGQLPQYELMVSVGLDENPIGVSLFEQEAGQ